MIAAELSRGNRLEVVMARPRKCRKICCYPDYWSFGPVGEGGQLPPVVMSLDEYEVLRLLDYCGLTQEECARAMEVARTTVTGVYDSARKKMVTMLVEGRALRISGGNISLKLCEKLRPAELPEKGSDAMRIAVCYENGEIFQHFGRTEQFKLYDIENGAVQSARVVGTEGAGHGALAGFLKAVEADALICGGIGGGARMALSEAGIQLYPGVSGDADAAAAALAKGELKFDPATECFHHGEHHGEGHSCGHHGEGHGCGHHEG